MVVVNGVKDENAVCFLALQNQPLMDASKPAEVWVFSK